jgi:hypothetical protein
MTRAWRQGLAACALGGVVGCAPEFDIPPVVWRGEHYELATYEDVSTLCGGTLEYSDRVAGHLIQQVAVGEVSERLRLHWIPDEDAFAEVCPSFGLGCAREEEPRAVSLWPMHQHELVHVLRGMRSRPVSEGVAEYFGDDRPILVAGEVEPLYRDGGQPPGEDYGRVAHFVSYLIERFGQGTTLAFEAATRDGDPYERVAAAALAELGVDLAVLMDDYVRDYPDCILYHFRDNAIDCETNVRVLDPTPDAVFEEDVSLDCGDPTVLGPREGKKWTYLTFEVLEPSYYVLSIFNRPGTPSDRIRISRCGGSCYDEADTVRTSATNLQQAGACWSPGRYVVRLETGEDEHGDFLVRVRTIEHGSCE